MTTIPNIDKASPGGSIPIDDQIITIPAALPSREEADRHTTTGHQNLSRALKNSEEPVEKRIRAYRYEQ
jgi:hypothetical protein